MVQFAKLRPAQQAEHTAAQAAAAAAQTSRQQQRAVDRAARVAAFKEIPANVNSVPALRREVNLIKEQLRQLLDAEETPPTPT